MDLPSHMTNGENISWKNRGILGQETLYIKNGNSIWSLQHKNHRLLGRSSLDLGETWSEVFILVEEYNGYFSFTISEDQTLHLICKNRAGKIVYLWWHGEDFATEVLGDDWIAEEKVTYQTILIDKWGITNIIYFTENPLDEIWRIKHCCKMDSKWTLPEVVDYGVGVNAIQGTAAISPEGSIHLVYQVVIDKRRQLIYRQRQVETTVWSEKMAITNSNRDNLYPCLVIDSKENLHLTWIRSDQINFRVVYRRKTKGGWMVGGWQKEQWISPTGVNAYHPTVAVTEEQVILIWQQTEGIYQCKSLDNGQSFSEPVLEKKYQKLMYQNLLPIDIYIKNGLSTTTTFDTGTTAMVLLATVFQEQLSTENHHNLPGLVKKQNWLFPHLEHLPEDYGQKDLQQHIENMNGKFQRLFFESEDVRLTNTQMLETIDEKTKFIQQLTEELSTKDKSLKEADKKIKKLQNIIAVLKENITSSNKDLKVAVEQRQQIFNKNKEQQEQLKNVKNQLSQREQELNKHHQLLKELEVVINLLKQELAEKEKQLKEQLEEQIPFWKKYFNKF